MLKDANSVIRQFKELEKRVKVLEKILSSNERETDRKYEGKKKICPDCEGRKRLRQSSGAWNICPKCNGTGRI